MLYRYDVQSFFKECTRPACWGICVLCGRCGTRRFVPEVETNAELMRFETVEIPHGSRKGGPRTPAGWNQILAVLVENLTTIWCGRKPAVDWALSFPEFEMLVCDVHLFLMTGSVCEANRRTQEVWPQCFRRKGCRSTAHVLRSQGGHDGHQPWWI